MGRGMPTFGHTGHVLIFIDACTWWIYKRPKIIWDIFLSSLAVMMRCLLPQNVIDDAQCVTSATKCWAVLYIEDACSQTQMTFVNESSITFL